MVLNVVLEHKSLASLVKTYNFVSRTYILLCDLLMHAHVSQPKTQFSTLSDNSTVSSCALLF